MLVRLRRSDDSLVDPAAEGYTLQSHSGDCVISADQFGDDHSFLLSQAERYTLFRMGREVRSFGEPPGMVGEFSEADQVSIVCSQLIAVASIRWQLEQARVSAGANQWVQQQNMKAIERARAQGYNVAVPSYPSVFASEDVKTVNKLEGVEYDPRFFMPCKIAKQ
ncbi:hypothetical protein EW146_g3263 [Bondarzewia mesenterica]|uniref:Uncharacterized protein n=1 Tax=Bondarzewia mesenterica TaxID=1095465 RepID=A0A4S4LYE0_9AGAM|nr:hypothetical protein EW146_g3263 [Bondarzewia mesenterica]